MLADIASMTEEFLQFIWNSSLVLDSTLVTTDGQPIGILDKGQWNDRSGPDFSNAYITIDGVHWYGPVEIHLKSSDWYAHNHSSDPAYDQVILHVVFEDDQPVRYRSGDLIPTLVLDRSRLIDEYWRYERWLSTDQKLVCARSMGDVPIPLITDWIEFLGCERWKERQKEVEDLRTQLNGNILKLRSILVARTVGMPSNSYGLEVLARRLPDYRIIRHSWDWPTFRSWILELAGFAESPTDQYIDRKFNVAKLGKEIWSWGKLRPSSFPSVRVQQWAWWYFQVVILKKPHKSFLELDFWQNSDLRSKPGKQTLSMWAINTAPWIDAKLESTISSECSWNKIPPEKSEKLTTYVELGVPNRNALHSQGILNLSKSFCQQKKCLNCHIGKHLLKQRNYD